MNGGQSQADRVLIDASRSARSHAERHLAAKTQEERDRLNDDWNDTAFDAAYDFSRRWNEGKVK